MPFLFKRSRAVFALAKASLKAILHSPISVVFSLLFPIIFIVVFGSMVDTRMVQLKIALAPGCDTANAIYKAIAKMNNITIDSRLLPTDADNALQKGRLTAVMDIKKDGSSSLVPHYIVSLTSGTSSKMQVGLLQTLLTNIIALTNQRLFPANPSFATLQTKELPGRAYRQIDFILPGQLGFSLLMAGVFGSAFILFSLRKGLVFKRLSAAPLGRSHIIVAEMLSRLVFQVISFTIMIILGYFAFQFTLVNGFVTFLEMMLFSLFGLVIFMGIGFIISGLVESESSIAPIANTVTLPQILLCGLFFSVDSYPHWLQSVCNILPLTFFVDGLRRIAFEGTHIWHMPYQVAGLCAWALVMNVIAIKVFKWE
jgi:ABC-2 type transport system permease protein